MKKTFLFMMALFVELCCHAQSLSEGFVDEENGATVLTCTSSKFGERPEWSLYLGKASIDDYFSYYLGTWLRADRQFELPEHATMVIKTGNGDEISIKGINKDSRESKYDSKMYLDGDFIKIYYVDIPFKIGAKDLKTIFEQGVESIRVELKDDEYLEKYFKKENYISPILEKQYDFLEGFFKNSSNKELPL